MAKSSKKFSPIVIVLILAVAAVIGVGAFMLMGGNKVKNGSSQGGENAFTSIRDALSKSVSLECEMTDNEGRMTKAYIKNGAVRADVTDPNPENSGSMIMKDKTLYTWQNGEGVMMSLPEGDYEANAEPNQGDSLIDDLEQYKNYCKPGVVSDSLFTPPSDVTFTDFSNMMEGKMDEDTVKKMMEQYGEE